MLFLLYANIFYLLGISDVTKVNTLGTKAQPQGSECELFIRHNSRVPTFAKTYQTVLMLGNSQNGKTTIFYQPLKRLHFITY